MILLKIQVCTCIVQYIDNGNRRVQSASSFIVLSYHNIIYVGLPPMLHNPYAEVLNPSSFINKYPYPVPAMCRKRSHTQ